MVVQKKGIGGKPVRNQQEDAVKIGKQRPPVLAIEKLGLALGMIEEDPVEALARYGARLVVSSYIEAEVEAHLGAGWYERAAERQGQRNGRRARGVSCGVGQVVIDYPKVRGCATPFQSAVLAAWQRKSQTLLATLPSLYVEGLSTRDYARALAPLWQGTSLSRSTVSRANEQIAEAFGQWRQRSLAEEAISYLFLDGHFEGVRMGTPGKEAILVAHGVRPDGQRVLLGVWLGCHEDTASWKLALQDLVGRGLTRPWLIISDGNPGLIRAVREVWPKALRQRCIVHRIRNVLARIPKAEQPMIRKALNRIFYAPSEEEARAEARRFAAQWANLYPEAVRTLGRDLADCLTFFRLPPRHWKRLRTSNTLERLFREVRRRTRVIGRLPNELAALSLVWTILEPAAQRWHGLIMDAYHRDKLQEGLRSLEANPIRVEGFEELRVA
jgi:transposase-like protein